MCDVLDLILLQKWLLAVPGTHLADSNAADLDQDDDVDVFDLAYLKREVLRK